MFQYALSPALEDLRYDQSEPIDVFADVSNRYIAKCIVVVLYGMC